MLSSAMLIIVPADILQLNSATFERSYEGVLGFLVHRSEKVRHISPSVLHQTSLTVQNFFFPIGRNMHSQVSHVQIYSLYLSFI